MNRRGTGSDIRALFTKLRGIPGLILRTSVITGLPGEGEDELDELCEFLREFEIERAGVFAYSPQEGTAAAGMPGRPDEETAARRADQLTLLQADIYDISAERRVGTKTELLVSGYDPESSLWYGEILHFRW